MQAAAKVARMNVSILILVRGEKDRKKKTLLLAFYAVISLEVFCEAKNASKSKFI